MRVVQACLPVPGHLGPNLALADALRGRGHEVAVYSGEAARTAVERERHAFFPFDPTMDVRMMRQMLPPGGHSPTARASTDRRGLLRVGALNATLREWFVETIPQQVEDLEGVVASFGADVLVSDSTLMGPLLVLKERLPLPVVVFSVLAACSVPGPEAPPWGRGLPPPRGPLTRARAWLESGLMDLLLGDLRCSASRMRRRFGLPPLTGRIVDETSRVPLFLVTSTPELDYDRSDLPPSVRYVGACVWKGNGSDPAPSWLADLPADRPVVHVTEGTIHTRDPLVLRAAARGLSDRPLSVIMTTGRHRRPEELDLGRRGANVRVEQFVPHHALFEVTSVAVTTGGAGTVTTALLAGVPLVVVPTGWDLPENAQRVAEAGAGVRLDPRRCTPRRLRAAVETVLADPAYRANARRVGAALAARGGAAAAALSIEELLGAGAAKPAPALAGGKS